MEVLRRYSNLSYTLTNIRNAAKASTKPLKPGRSHPTPLPVRRRLPKPFYAQVIAAYQAGATTTQLAAEYDVSKSCIKHLLHKAGVVMRNQPLTAEQVGEAAALRAQGLSTYQIAEKFGVVQSTVWRALR